MGYAGVATFNGVPDVPKEIRDLNFGSADNPVLALLRRVLRESRAVARKKGITTRVRLALKRPEAGPAGRLPIWRDIGRLAEQEGVW